MTSLFLAAAAMALAAGNQPAQSAWTYRARMAIEATATRTNPASPLAGPGTASWQSGLLFVATADGSWEPATRVRFAGGAVVTADQDGDVKARAREGYLRLSAAPWLDVEAGKRLVRWGVGYGYAPTGILDPPKDSSDPTDRLGRNEGTVLARGDVFRGPASITIVAAAPRQLDGSGPDVVFLDVQMPELTGLDVLSRLQHRPRVVFVTAHDEFAVRAFEERAVDFLLKPVEPERLARTVDRLQEQESPAARLRERENLQRLVETMSQARPVARRIAVRRGPTVTLVEPESILFCRAEDKYAVLYTADGEQVADRTIEELEAALDPQTFLRIHRSAIVNLLFVKDLTAIEGGRFVVTLRDAGATKLYASRSGARMLRERLGF